MEQEFGRIRSRIVQFLMAEGNPRAGDRRESPGYPPGGWVGGDLESEISTFDENGLIEVLLTVAQSVDADRGESLKNLVRSTRIKVILENRLKSRVWWERLGALRVLQFLPMDEFKDSVVALQQDPRPLIRLEAIRASSGLNERELARVISRWPEIGWMLDHHPIDAAHERFGGPTILELEDLIGKEDHPEILVRLIELVPRLGGATNFLMEAAGHPDLSVRLAALKVMANVWSDEVRRELIVSLEDKDWRVRALAARSLAAHGHTDSVRAIAHLLLDKDPRVKMSAGVALKQLGPSGISVLRYMSRKSRAPEHRRLFAQVLGLPER